MLTAELVRPRISRRGEKLSPKLLQPGDEAWLKVAAELLDLYRNHVGQIRSAIQEAYAEYEGTRIDYVVTRGLSRVIAGKCTWVMAGSEAGADDAEQPALQGIYRLPASQPLKLVAEERPAYSADEAASEQNDQPVADGDAQPNKLYLVPAPPAPTELRTAVWGVAAQMWPVVRHADSVFMNTRSHVLVQVGEQYTMSEEQVGAGLFADLPDEQVLEAVPDWKPADVILRYNLELARGLLYWASEMRVIVRGNYKDLFRYMKLFKLMHTIRPLDDGGYHIMIDGPMSPFVQSSTRYGRQMARFLPALLLCPGWEMEADVQLRSASGATEGLYRLDAQTPNLHTWFPSSGAFDSRLEQDFAAEFEEKYTRNKRPWSLSREDELIPLGDTVMIPDFALTHKDGRRALVELVGFWHPDYLRRKIAKLRAAGRSDMIVLVYAGLACSPADFDDVASEVLFFVEKPVLKDVIAAAERRAVLPGEEPHSMVARTCEASE